MQFKDLPLRKCVACNQMFTKSNLYRIVRIGDTCSLDLTYKGQGRGAYICKNKECIDMAAKKKALSRALKCAVNQEVFNSLYMELENGR